MFSFRTRWDLTPNRLARALDARRKAGLPVLDLTCSNPTQCGIPYDRKALSEALAEASCEPYAPDPRGRPEARVVLSERYRKAGLPVDPDRIILTAGTSEAYAFLFRLLADPGEAVLVPRPSYPLFDYLASLSDVRGIPYPLRYSGAGWRIDAGALRDAWAPAVRAVLVVNPNNPTGSFVDADERRMLLDLCRERGAPLVSDEVFAEYPFDGRAVFPRFAGADGALTFTLGGLSKSAGLPQMKLSWIVVGGPAAAAEEAVARLELIADTYLSVGEPVQRALPRLLELGEGIRDAILRRVRGNRSALLERTGPGRGVRCLDAEGGWCAVLARDADRGDDESWAVSLLEEGGVSVHPGHFYDFAEEGRLVVSLLVPPDVFREGVGRILDLSR